LFQEEIIMVKRILAIALSLVMVFAMAAVAVSAAEVDSSAGADTTNSTSGASGVIYFDCTGWNNVTQIYCHVWQNGGKDFFGWQFAEEKCEKVSGNIWKYDLAKLNDSENISGGLKAGGDYCVIFSSMNGPQTYDSTIGTECIGDRAYITGNMIENPVDSEKKGFECAWKKNSGKYGPHFAITSIGNFVGTSRCPGETGVQIIGDWIVTYSGNTSFCDPVEVVANAFKKLNVKDLDAVYAYAKKKLDEGGSLATPEKIKSQLEAGYKKAYPNATAKVDEEKAEEIGNKLDGGASLDDIVSEPSENGSTGGSNGSTGGNVSGSGNDGQNDAILFVLAGIMLVSAAAFVVTRKRTEV
jgi:LPXTG-motif cell wall-anchored protein